MSDLSWMRPKLAELCGYRPSKHKMGIVGSYAAYSSPTHGYIAVHDFRPDEDVAQAVRCLEEVAASAHQEMIEIKGWGSGWSVGFHSRSYHPLARSHALPRAICLAIAAALGWEKP